MTSFEARHMCLRKGRVLSGHGLPLQKGYTQRNRAKGKAAMRQIVERNLLPKSLEGILFYNFQKRLGIILAVKKMAFITELPN